MARNSNKQNDKVKVIMLASLAGPDLLLKKGQVTELDKATAEQWVKGGLCKLV